MADVLSTLNQVSQIAKLVQAVTSASKGDKSALNYLSTDGWVDALEVYRPGAGEIGKQVLQQTRAAFNAITRTIRDDVIEGEYRVVNEPWQPFLERLLTQKYGAHIILGPVGSGKTTLAQRLAQRFRNATGYTVEAVNMYKDDVPDFATIITIETLTKRMVKLRQYLRSTATQDEDEDSQAPSSDNEHKDGKSSTLPPTHRIIIIDEAILAMSTSAMDPGRRAALQALAQCRHLNWIVVYIGQWAGQLPLPVLGQSTLWVKEPSGREATTDRDHPIVRDLWQRTQQSFDGLSKSDWYAAPFKDRRSWAFVDCQSLNGERGYSGMVPFTPIS